MIVAILFILIGIKLDILNGWYLGLIITKIALDLIGFGIKCIKLGRGDEE